MTEKIFGFFDEYRWLSNFWLTPIELETPVEMLRFPSAEHAYQAAKSEVPGQWQLLSQMPYPGDAKRFGLRHIRLRDGWDSMKVDVMRQILEVKFSDPTLRQKLIATGNAELVEANEWGDSFWGYDVKREMGQNKLGQLLMQLRKELQP